MEAQSKSTRVDDADVRVRRRLITVVASVLFAFGTYFVIRRLVEHPIDGTSVFLAVGTLLMVVAAAWTRRSDTSQGPAHLICGAMLVVVFAVAYRNGGGSAPAAEWFVAVTMLALFLIGPRTSMVYALLSSVAFMGFHFSDALGVPLPTPTNPGYLDEVRLFSRVATLLFVVFVGWLFAREKQDASALAHAAKEDLDVVLHNLPHGVLVIRGGTVHSANDAVARMLDASPEQLVGLSIDALLSLPEPLPESLPEAFPEALAGMQTFESELMSRSGDAVAARVTPVTLRDVQGKHVLVLSIEDIRHQIALETQLQTSKRMVSLGTMAAGMAHEINNPLASMSANLDYVKEGIDDAELVEALEDSEDGIRRIAEVVRDLQLFSVGEAPRSKATAVNVEACVRSAQRLCRQHLEGIDDVDVRVGSDVTVDGDEGDLVRVLVNLLVNAAQAIKRSDTPYGRIVVRCATHGAWVEIEVEDNGPGLEAGTEDRIFDPFFTTRDVGEGMGLGLPICHQLMLKMGGTIRVQTRSGRGTTFVLRLRQPEETSAAAATAVAEPSEPSEPSTDSLRVLVVEDDAMVVRALRRTLAPDTVFVEGGSDALRCLERDAFDVILCDVMMPGMNGRELFEHIEDAHPTMAPRVLFMTGGAFTDETRAFLERVPNRCLAKPIRPEELDSALGALGRRP